MEALLSHDFSVAQDYYEQCGFAATIWERIDGISPLDEYITAGRLLEEGKLQEAAEAFGQLQGVLDADELLIEAQYNYAQSLLDTGKYQEAADIFDSLNGALDSANKAIKAQYNYAAQLADDGNYTDALSKLNKLYKNYAYEPAHEKWIELKYRYALEQIDDGAYVAAFNNLNAIHEEYAPAEEELEVLKPILYDAGVESYNNGSYSEAKTLFSPIKDDYESAASYLLLAGLHNTSWYSPNEIDQLLDLVGFADANTLIEQNETALCEFLLGTWYTSGRGYHISMSEQSSGGYWFECNFPSYPSGAHFFIRNGIYKVGDSEESSVNYLEFTIVDDYTVKVYCYPNGQTYTMYW